LLDEPINDKFDSTFADALSVSCETDQHICTPTGKNLFKVSKITLEKRPFGLFSGVIFLTLNMFLPAGRIHHQKQFTNYLSAGKKLFKVRKITIVNNDRAAFIKLFF